MRLIRKIAIRTFAFLTSPQRIEKVKEAADFHKKCEYFQKDIQLLFDRGIFDLADGSAEIHKNSAGQISKIKVIQWK